MEYLNTKGDLKQPKRKLLRITTQTLEVSENGFTYIIDTKTVEYEIE